MNSSIVGLALLFVFTSCTPKSISFFPTAKPENTGVTGSGIDGAILTKTQIVPMPTEKQEIFKPSEDDILQAEILLKNYLKTRPIKGRETVAKSKLHYYFRQYVGLLTKDGNKLIHINGLWNKRNSLQFIRGFDSPEQRYTSDYIYVFDGGSSYWAATINLTQEKVVGFGVHGVS